MRDNNQCKVVLTLVDFIKTMEIGNNDMSPKEELSVEQSEEATDIIPEAVKSEKSTGSNAEVSTTLLTGQEEEPPIFEKAMEMGNNNTSPKRRVVTGTRQRGCRH